MMYINCSEKCIYNNNGICTLDKISNTSYSLGNDNDCAYFTSKKNIEKTSLNM